MTIREIVSRPIGEGAAPTNPSVTLSTTPDPGDLIVVVATGLNNSTPRTLTGITGCGASWSTVHEISPASGVHLLVALGTGATSSGTITATFSSGRYGILDAYLIGGMGGSTVSATSTAHAAAGTSLAGPVASCVAGDLVIDVLHANTTAAGTSWSRSGFTDRPLGVESRVAAPVLTGGSAYRQSTAAESVSTSASTATAVQLRVGQVLIHPPPAAPIAAVCPMPVAAALAALSIGAVLGATAPAPSAAAAAQLVQPVQIGATAPAPSASLTGQASVLVQIGATAPAPSATAAAQLVQPVQIGATAPAPFASLRIVREKQTPRHLLAAELAAYLPTDYQLMPYARDGIAPMQVTVMLAVDNLARFDPAPAAARTTIWRLIVVTGRDDPDLADDELDNAVHNVLDAIESNPQIPAWTNAERGIYGDKLPCYEITLPMHYLKES